MKRGSARSVRRGFTLLEVMVAVAILGLGLTVILSSQAGLVAGVQRVRSDTEVIGLLRCKMNEIEVELQRDGFRLLDQNDSGDCCEDEDAPGFGCEWKIETIELPQPASFTQNTDDTGDSLDDALDNAVDGAKETADASSSGLSGLGALGVLGQIGATDGAALGEGAGLDDMANLVGESAPAGPGGIIQMALGLVYPNLKPMLEASIRKVTVSVKWKEGEKERDYSVVQYVTNPLEGALSPNAADGLDEALKAAGIGDADADGGSKK